MRGETMGTTWRIELFAAVALSTGELRDSVNGELDRLVGQMSHWRVDSDVMRFNQSPPGWVNLPSDLLDVLESALRVAEETDGAFDATVKPLVDLWGFGPNGTAGTLPQTVDVAAAKARRGCSQVIVDGPRGKAFQPGGVSFDLSSIAKGFAVDRITASLDLPDVSSCLVEIGVELRGRGVKPDGQPWWVALEIPPDAVAFPDTVVALCNLSIASSGDYRRYFESGGRRYTHTIDPKTGYPVQHGLASVTVLHEHCMLADAYSTAFAVLGPDEGTACANKLGVAVQFVLRHSEGCDVRCSRAFQEMLD